MPRETPGVGGAMLGPQRGPGSFPTGDAGNAAAVPEGAEPFPGALRPSRGLRGLCLVFPGAALGL